MASTVPVQPPTAEPLAQRLAQRLTEAAAKKKTTAAAELRVAVEEEMVHTDDVTIKHQELHNVESGLSNARVAI